MNGITVSRKILIMLRLQRLLGNLKPEGKMSWPRLYNFIEIELVLFKAFHINK